MEDRGLLMVDGEKLPDGWSFTTIGEACQIKPPKKEVRTSLDDDDEVSMLPMSDLGVLDKTCHAKQIRRLGEVYKGYTYFADGDVLLAKITPCFENGKLGIARDLRNGVGFGSSEYIVLRPGHRLDREFLFYYLSRDSFRGDGSRIMTGAVGHKRVPTDFVESYPIPLPPLPEQRRIVAILDEAFEGIDRAIANTEQNLASARELFESYLNRVFTEKGEGWVERKLGEVAENLDSRRVPITKSKRTSGDVPYYGASGIVDYVADYLFDEDLLLVSEDGANLLARTYSIAFSISGKTWVNNHAHVLRFPDVTSQRFTEYYLNSISLEPWISGMAQPKLNQRALNSIPVPDPSGGEKEEVVHSLDLLADNRNRLESHYTRKLAALAELKQSILQKAFSGELTGEENQTSQENQTSRENQTSQVSETCEV